MRSVYYGQLQNSKSSIFLLSFQRDSQKTGYILLSPLASPTNSLNSRRKDFIKIEAFNCQQHFGIRRVSKMSAFTLTTERAMVRYHGTRGRRGGGAGEPGPGNRQQRVRGTLLFPSSRPTRQVVGENRRAPLNFSAGRPGFPSRLSNDDPTTPR